MGHRDTAGAARRGTARRRTARAARRTGISITALATAAVVAVPAQAQLPDEQWGDHTDPWPLLQEGESLWAAMGADAQGTHRGKALAPADPGIRWYVDLAEVETSFAPDGYDASGGLSRARGPALVSPEGTLIREMRNNDPQYDRVSQGREVIGIDPDDGSVVYEIPNVSTELQRCRPALDSQARLWSYQHSGPGEDEEYVRAFDPDTGAELASYTLIDDEGEGPTTCRRTALHIGGEGDDERLVLFGSGGDPDEVVALDISGADPTPAWQGVDDADEVVGVPGSTDRPKIAVFSDDAMFVTVRTGVDTDDEALSIVKLALDDGAELDRIELPTDAIEQDDVSSAEYDRLDLLLAYDHTLVVGTRGGPHGLLVGLDVTDGLSERWATPLLPGTSPAETALGSGVVLTQPSGAGGLAGQDRAVWGFEVLTGQAMFSGITMHTDLIVDAAGFSYTTTRASGDASPRYLASMQRNGPERWRIGREEVADALGVDDFDDDLDLGNFGSSTKLGPIDAEGVLYVHREGGTGLLALDNSGGLGEFTVPFPDVDADSVHAQNIARLAARRITTGDADGNYDPAGTITRAQFATFLARAFELEPIDGDHFTDVEDGNVHAGNIYAVADAGITVGVTATTFEPDATLTRAQMASLLARAFELDEVDGDHFTDVDPDSVHAGNIYAVADAGITVGVTATTFAPEDTLRRDQMASLLMRGLDAAG